MSRLSQLLHRASGGLIPEINLLPHADDTLKELANEALNAFRPAILDGLDKLETITADALDNGAQAVKSEIVAHIGSIPGVPASYLAIAQGFVASYDLSAEEAIATSDVDALIEDVKQKVAGARF